MTTLNTIQLSETKRLRIVIDENPMNPRERENISKLCIREHRHYIFPNELNFDFEREENADIYEDEGLELPMDEIEKKYYVFHLDCYEHSGISFSLTNRWSKQPEKYDGFIAIPREDNSKEEAEEHAEQEIKTYNQYLNGEVYGGVIEVAKKWTSKDGQTKIEREHEDSCYGFYSEQDVIENFS